MVSSLKVQKGLGFLSSLTVLIMTGIFTISTGDTFTSYTSEQKEYFIFLVLSETILAFFVIYQFMYVFWSGITSCYRSDNTPVTTSFSLSKAIWFLIGIGLHATLCYYLAIKEVSITHNLILSGWLLISNLGFVLILGLAFALFRYCRKRRSRQRENRINYYDN